MKTSLCLGNSMLLTCIMYMRGPIKQSQPIGWPQLSVAWLAWQAGVPSMAGSAWLHSGAGLAKPPWPRLSLVRPSPVVAALIPTGLVRANVYIPNKTIEVPLSMCVAMILQGRTGSVLCLPMMLKGRTESVLAIRFKMQREEPACLSAKGFLFETRAIRIKRLS